MWQIVKWKLLRKKRYIIQYIKKLYKVRKQKTCLRKKSESKSIQLLNTYIAVVSSHKVNKLVTLYTCAYIHSKSHSTIKKEENWNYDRMTTNRPKSLFPLVLKRFRQLKTFTLSNRCTYFLPSIMNYAHEQKNKRIFPSWVCVHIGEKLPKTLISSCHNRTKWALNYIEHA